MLGKRHRKQYIAEDGLRHLCARAGLCFMSCDRFIAKRIRAAVRGLNVACNRRDKRP